MNTDRDKTCICLFDVDGTITAPRQVISHEMASFLSRMREKYFIGLVGGSDADKIAEQMGGSLEVLGKFDYVFAENGLVAFRNGSQFSEQDILKYMGEEKLQKFINFCLRYMSELTLPAKRGNFIEFRKGMINVCPVGRSCSQAEREQFAQYDKVHNVRGQFIEKLESNFKDWGLKFCIGGQISLDVFPIGWDKTFCLQHLEADGFKTIYFFGDKTMKGGNDHEIYEDCRTISNTVSCPEDTRAQLQNIFKNLI